MTARQSPLTNAGCLRSLPRMKVQKPSPGKIAPTRPDVPTPARVALETRVARATVREQMAIVRPPTPLQFYRGTHSGGADTGISVQSLAKEGLSGAPSGLPHLDRVQRSFGRHNVSGVDAHVGGAAATASAGMGARAYAYGNSVAFDAAPDLHTAAHEAAHVVQQRSGVQLAGGVGREGDSYEQHADAVADRVVAGMSAEDLLDQGATSAAPATQAAGSSSSATQEASETTRGDGAGDADPGAGGADLGGSGSESTGSADDLGGGSAAGEGGGSVVDQTLARLQGWALDRFPRGDSGARQGNQSMQELAVGGTEQSHAPQQDGQMSDSVNPRRTAQPERAADNGGANGQDREQPTQPASAPVVQRKVAPAPAVPSVAMDEPPTILARARSAHIGVDAPYAPPDFAATAAWTQDVSAAMSTSNELQSGLDSYVLTTERECAAAIDEDLANAATLDDNAFNLLVHYDREIREITSAHEQARTTLGGWCFSAQQGIDRGTSS